MTEKTESVMNIPAGEDVYIYERRRLKQTETRQLLEYAASVSATKQL